MTWLADFVRDRPDRVCMLASMALSVIPVLVIYVQAILDLFKPVLHN